MRSSADGYGHGEAQAAYPASDGAVNTAVIAQITSVEIGSNIDLCRRPDGAGYRPRWTEPSSRDPGEDALVPVRTDSCPSSQIQPLAAPDTMNKAVLPYFSQMHRHAQNELFNRLAESRLNHIPLRLLDDWFALATRPAPTFSQRISPAHTSRGHIERYHPNRQRPQPSSAGVLRFPRRALGSNREPSSAVVSTVGLHVRTQALVEGPRPLGGMVAVEPNSPAPLPAPSIVAPLAIWMIPEARSPPFEERSQGA